LLVGDVLAPADARQMIDALTETAAGFERGSSN
jgi:hypothetical protein